VQDLITTWQTAVHRQEPNVMSSRPTVDGASARASVLPGARSNLAPGREAHGRIEPGASCGDCFESSPDI
jgi:hypothetical protein